MTIDFACPRCRSAYRVAARLAGRTGTCPGCGSRLSVPADRPDSGLRPGVAGGMPAAFAWPRPGSPPAPGPS